ncbi:hypothetical protein GWK91_02710 [Virgibacillus sp. MSP4-1]|uniref:hypothetical protein n=1 Tax=Virgibacillus sp. MSP4-1 TaxID=2700081 RepID=UPI00039CCD03|nr:hypothetical protein [Virgibacillus sp. MSP4-1]QHS21917.1 hypothetical protein GWK91_02710 [Virgibacillus sp. MSP4-1]
MKQMMRKQKNLFLNLEETCHHCSGKGYVEVFSDRFREILEDLELLYPTFDQAMAIARDKYEEEIKQETCPTCNGNKVIPNDNGRLLISNKDMIVEFLQKQKLI